LSFLYSEVNLKIKQALPQTAHMVTPAQASQFRGVIKSEQPNNRLYNYDGVLSTSSAEEMGKTRDYALDPTQILLRGAQLRNTDWIYGVVVFTGHETKLMLNSRYHKQSQNMALSVLIVHLSISLVKSPPKSQM
jgi:phospholipid-transporting ATPase